MVGDQPDSKGISHHELCLPKLIQPLGQKYFLFLLPAGKQYKYRNLCWRCDMTLHQHKISKQSFVLGLFVLWLGKLLKDFYVLILESKLDSFKFPVDMFL